MKAILMSIRPQHTCNILNDIKLWEIRKKFPLDYVGWVYIYCTKDNNQLVKCQEKVWGYYKYIKGGLASYFNGKVIARFWCDKVEEYVNGSKLTFENGTYIFGTNADFETILKPSCLTEDELYDYCEDLSFKAIHITKLEIFDKPKEISEFSSFRKPYWNKKTRDFIKEEQKKFGCRIFRASRLTPLTRAPQSWCYIEKY